MSALAEMLEETRHAVADAVGTGRVADYIPTLARIDPAKFGLAVVELDGNVSAIGDADEPFSIQSISKVFTLTLALGQRGGDLWRRVGREPSGSAFNSIVQLEQERGIPRNPFINAGAIVVSDVVLDGRSTTAAIDEVLGLARRLADDPSIEIDAEVAASEATTGFRNAALANFMRGFGNLENPVDDVLDVYFHQCAIAMSCTQLARAALFLANDGRDPLTGEQIVRPGPGTAHQRADADLRALRRFRRLRLQRRPARQERRRRRHCRRGPGQVRDRDLVAVP